MTVAERNEAGEWLAAWVASEERLRPDFTEFVQDTIVMALAAERRMTVERIRQACIQTRGGSGQVEGYLWRILDWEAR